MPAPEAVITVLREWLVKADNDLLAVTGDILLNGASLGGTVDSSVLLG